jgi:hypothetical protein
MIRRRCGSGVVAHDLLQHLASAKHVGALPKLNRRGDFVLLLFELGPRHDGIFRVLTRTNDYRWLDPVGRARFVSRWHGTALDRQGALRHGTARKTLEEVLPVAETLPE